MIDQVDLAVVLRPRRSAQSRARRPILDSRDDHDELARRPVVDTEHLDVRKAHQYLAHARRVDLHSGSPTSKAIAMSGSEIYSLRSKGHRRIYVALVAVFVAVTVTSLWLVRPQAFAIEVTPPEVCGNTEELSPWQAAALVSGSSGVLYGTETLIPRQSGPLEGGETGHGWLHVSKGWFGRSPQYSFVADGGQVTQLTPTNRFIGSCVGELGY